MGLVIDLIKICLQGTFICQPPDPPPVSYYQPGYACYIDGTFHKECPTPDYLTKPTHKPYNRNNY